MPVLCSDLRFLPALPGAKLPVHQLCYHHHYYHHHVSLCQNINAVKCNLTELTTNSTAIITNCATFMIAANVGYAHVPGFHVLSYHLVISSAFSAGIPCALSAFSGVCN